MTSYHNYINYQLGKGYNMNLRSKEWVLSVLVGIAGIIGVLTGQEIENDILVDIATVVSMAIRAYSVVINVSLPLPVVAGICVLAAYAPLKLIKWLIPEKLKVEHKGLLWLNEGNDLIPVCPQCYCEVIPDEEVVTLPRSHHPSSVVGTMPPTRSTYTYRCLEHGELNVPNADLHTLKKEVKLLFEQKARKSRIRHKAQIKGEKSRKTDRVAQ